MCRWCDRKKHKTSLSHATEGRACIAFCTKPSSLPSQRSFGDHSKRAERASNEADEGKHEEDDREHQHHWAQFLALVSHRQHFL